MGRAPILQGRAPQPDIAVYHHVYKTLIRAARLTDVSAVFAMEEIKRTMEPPLALR
jgi:hypothetical protein